LKRLSAPRALACVFAALALALPGLALARPPMWIVHSRGATIMLFGSIHLLPPGLDWRPPELDAALEKADELWFELPITMESDREATEASAALGALPPDAHLTALMSAGDAAKMLRAAVALNCEPDALDKMRPWMAELTLSVAQDAKSGASAFNGVEDQVQAITPLAAERRAFETATQQIGFLAGAPMNDQLASLSWTLYEIEDDPLSYQRVVGEWMDADIEGLQRDAIDPLRRISHTLYNRLILDRNRAWTRALTARLKKKGLVVVVVGVGHLVGPDSVPAMLRAKGYAVEGP
jgi:uncharacterized protein YbaP (TraB family)